MEIRNEEKEVEGIGIMNFKKYKEGKYSVKEWSDGSKAWFFKRVLHKENGPACDYKEYKKWFLEGEEYTEKEWRLEMRKKKLKVLGL